MLDNPDEIPLARACYYVKQDIANHVEFEAHDNAGKHDAGSGIVYVDTALERVTVSLQTQKLFCCAKNIM